MSPHRGGVEFFLGGFEGRARLLCHSTIIITSHDKVNRRTILMLHMREKNVLENTFVEGFLFLKKLLLLLF